MRNRLKEIRLKEYMMTQTEFAEMLGVNMKAYNNWELNKSIPDLKILMQIANKLNRHIEDIWY